MNPIPVMQDLLLHADAIDKSAIVTVLIDDDVMAVLRYDLQLLARSQLVAHHKVIAWVATNRDRRIR